MTRDAHAETSRWRLPWLLLCLAPAIVGLGTFGVRLLLHHGAWPAAMTTLAVSLTFASVTAIVTSAVTCTYAPRGRSAATFLVALAAQVAAGVGLLNGLWAVLPFHIAGP